MKTTPSEISPRFVWLVGAIAEQYPDLPDTPRDGTLILWDRQFKKSVATVAPEYSNAMCLEITTTPDGAPFTTLETWFNGLSVDALQSEGIPA